MRTAIDTNVISALWSDERSAREIASQLREAHAEGGLIISAPVHSELVAHPKATEVFVDEFLSATRIAIDFDLEERIWREAARRFARYAQRRRHSAGNTAKRLLADFIIGAHALARADRLMTLDPVRYVRDFPDLKLM
ncbi:MAG: PIN domain-containing protein [Acidobacteriaceae bacterium]|nr:PIN domain-containing protein [Acidobacteriaceae bacterium]MBV9296020.1 PIN domain-containing protein [Acidobacteriaceae bacterium]